MALAGLLWLTGCGGKDEAATVPKTAEDWFAIKVGGAVIDMQVAVRSAEMERGLMGRRDLRDDQGMLFVYRSAQPLSFWMRNTPTPLDLGFFTSDGVLREVYPLHPFDETPVKSRRDDVQFALELKRGGFAQHGIKVGARLDTAALAAALEARGFTVRQFEGLGE